MCTALTYKTIDDYNFLARTMDFSFQLDAEPVFIPRDYTFNSHIENESFTSKYSFIGAGKDMEGYAFADGLNEKGFGIAALYFEKNAKFSNRKNNKKTNVASDELVTWALGNISSVNDFEDKIKTINIVGVINKTIGSLLPLHWIISDNTGTTKCLEITSNGVALYDNSVGVMTNSPNFPWHLTNLSHYNELQPTEPSEKKYADYLSIPDGPGNGLMGLPGDYSAASRFIRASVIRQYISKVKGPELGLNAIIHILNAVDIPKGIKITNSEKQTSDYTQYKGVMNLTNLSYYMLSYDSFLPRKVTLDKKLILQKEPIVFSKIHDYNILDSFDKLKGIVSNGIDLSNLETILSKLQK